MATRRDFEKRVAYASRWSREGVSRDAPELRGGAMSGCAGAYRAMFQKENADAGALGILAQMGDDLRDTLFEITAICRCMQHGGQQVSLGLER